MKRISKFLGILLIMALVMSMGITAAFADGSDGKVTIENATVGVTYKAYKVFDATLGEGDAISYTVTSELYTALGGTADADLVAGPFTISKTADASGNHNVQLTDSSTDAATIGEWIKNNLAKFAQVDKSKATGLDTDEKATANTVIFDGLAYGYYYVTSGLGSEVTIDSANKEVTIKDKNPQTPQGPDKEITKEDAVIDNSDETFNPGVAANDAAVGSKESFKITYTATNWVTTGSGENVTTKKVTKFYIEDQPRNLTIDPATVAVTVGETSVIAAGAVVDSTGHPATVTVASGDAGKLEITIDWVDGDGNSIYSAADGQANINVTLTYDATVLPGAATDNGDNTVTVKYDRTGDDKVDLGNDKTETDTYKFKLDKTDGSAGLTGAKFELKLGDTKVSFIDVNGDGSVYRVAGVGETGTTTIDLKENSSTEIRGLDKQDYALTEIEAPKGYNKLTADVPVSKDNLTKADETIADSTKIEVINNQGTELPSTGGIGTTIFYVVGSILVVAAGVLLITKKRMNREG